MKSHIAGVPVGLWLPLTGEYHYDKFLEKTVDPDQIVPKGTVWSRATLYASLPASFGYNTLW